MFNDIKAKINGIVCIELEDIAPAKKKILSSRSFGVLVRDFFVGSSILNII